MALKSTVFKAELQVSDLDRHYYATHALTLARHPSETDERMMARLLAFALFAGERLEFGRGLSAEDEPALWQKDLTGAIELWIEVGLPDERVVRRACGKAERVVVVCYGGRGADLWWGQNRDRLERLRNLTVMNLPAAASQALAALARRSMSLQCTIQDGQAWLTDGTDTVHIETMPLQSIA
ncbi:MAG: YaeQ family protein [Zoogloeaceae bacterium]|nr:YaeQ family protein [Zoogloeaceae bacterium]MCK6384989.1 YaeQ family protein [Rhodocyclaceae bacterium]